jgi:hypothetical protein
VSILRAHLLDERLTIDEYAERVGQAWAATSRPQLDSLLADLPVLGDPRPGAPRRRHGEGAVPAVTWRPTSERFRDPTTHRVMRVWVDVGDGGRHYVEDA